MLNKLSSIILVIIALITVINHESFLLLPPQSCKWRRTWIPNNYKLLMLFESIPHTKDTYSGFKLEQISFPGDNGHCIASFWGKKRQNKKLADIASLRDPGKQKRTLGSHFHKTPWVRQEWLGSSHSVLCNLPHQELGKLQEPGANGAVQASSLEDWWVSI